ncbi:hypothetical protein [Kitasatospora sp. NPDC057015]|uniref:hypothetical protein n=1 Tax=Kitasatospora sp. NPDC057015 TaxID=3346001 RepID=UPI00363A6ACE
MVAPAAARSAVLRWLTGADWRPALRVVLAPTGVLLVAALLAAIPSDYGGAFPAPFGSRLGAALAASLAALGAPFALHVSPDWGVDGGQQLVLEYLLRVAPLTVTALWLLALWLGLRIGLRRRQARSGEQLTGRRAFGEAVRTGLVAAAVTLVLGVLAGGSFRPARGAGVDVDLRVYPSLTGFGLEARWLEAVPWTFLLAGLTALLVYGTDAARWAAWRSTEVRGWAVAALSAARVIGLVVAVASAAAFVVVAVQGSAGATLSSLAFLPNLGLQLLGFGSGATFEAGRQYGMSVDGLPVSGVRFSFFDLHDAPGDWRWAGLLAVLAVVLLGRSALRHRLGAAERIKLAVLYAAFLSLLMLLGGAGLTVSQLGMGGMPGVRGYGQTSSAGLALASVVLANVVWAAVGALAVPRLLASLGVGRSGAVGAAGIPAQTPHGGGETGAHDFASAPQGPPTVVPPTVVPAPTDLLDSDRAAASAGSGPALSPAPSPEPSREAGEDPSVWRRQDQTDA